MLKKMKHLFSLIAISHILAGCQIIESFHTVETTPPIAANIPFAGVKPLVSLGKFDNRSTYGRGKLTDGIDRLSGQAGNVLLSYLQQTNRFILLDRENMSESQQEASFQGKRLQPKGANYIISGVVSEFGRRELGDRQLFGILGRGRTQIAYAKVILNVINVETSEIILSTQGAGEYDLSNREIIGFGTTASYDETLNTKVLDLAIRDAVNHMTQAIDSGAWQIRL